MQYDDLLSLPSIPVDDAGDSVGLDSAFSSVGCLVGLFFFEGLILREVFSGT